jgi:hypothetical protein
MTTPRLLGVAGLALCTLTFAWTWLLSPLLLVALIVIGELWVRALTRETLPAAARIGLGVTTALISLPLVALVLHLAGVPIRSPSLTAGLAVLTAGLGGVALLRERSGRPVADPRFARTLAAVAVSGAVALVVGGTATFAYVRMPHPPPPGFTSVALGGWAAGIDHPVAIPARGLRVPLRVSSAGEPETIAPLAVLVGDRPAGAPRPLRIAADATSAIEVLIPAPPDGCLHRIQISVGTASTVFYGRGPAAC